MRRRRLEPDVGDHDLAGVRATRRDHEAELSRVERHGEVGLDRLPGDLAGRGVDPGRQIHRDHRATRVVHALDRPGRVRSGLAVEAGPEEGVDDDVGAGRVVGLLRVATCLAQHARSDPPVAAVRAAPADDGEATRVGKGPQRLVGDGGARALHQLAGGLRIAGISLLGRAHLLGGEERLVHHEGRGRRTGGASSSATHVAAATVCECVSETSISRIPTRSAKRRVLPASVIPGFGGPTISISFQVKSTPQPSALPTASLPQKRRRVGLGGVAPRLAVVLLGPA